MTLSQDDLLKVFVEEALEHLSSIENDFLALEKAGDVYETELVNRVFRAAHSIKGGAGFIGLHNIKDLSHKMETVLGCFRKEKLAPDVETINCLLLASDTLKKLIVNVEASDRIDISLPMQALNTVDRAGPPFLPPKNRPAPKTTVQRPSFQEITSKMAITENDLLMARNEGKTIYILRMDAGPDARLNGRSSDEVMDDIKSYMTFLSSRTEPVENAGPDESDAGLRSFLLAAFACVLSPEDVALLLDVQLENLFWADGTSVFAAPCEGSVTSSDFKIDDVTGVLIHQDPADMESGLCQRNKEAFKDAVHGSEFEPVAHDVLLHCAENTPSNDILPTSIRVSTQLLDALVNLAGELVLSRNQLLKAVAVKDQTNTDLVGKRVDAITTELQKVIMMTRMQPVGSLFNRFPRIVRDLSRELGKETELVIEGADVELDRTLLEAMSDPLNHLIRNAADHGIETVDIRKRNGKVGTGKISLRAFSEAGQVVIEVSDDGAGIDPEKVAAAAVLKGFVTEDQVSIMADRDKLNLIFLPGFSTAGKITDLSGRGVGMDVVKTNLDNLGGLIDLVSSSGKGTRIIIKLSLTLAIIPCQIVFSEGERFAIPQMNLEKLLRISAVNVKERIERVGDAEVVRLQGKLLPLVRLTDVLKIVRTYIDPETKLRKPDRRHSISDRRSRKSPLLAGDFEIKPTVPLAGGNEAPLVSSPAPTCPGPSEVPLNRKTADRRLRAASALNIAVVSTGRIIYGLIVERFHDSEEIVVKPLGRHLKACRGYAGATIMGDGRVALILDVNSLSEMAALFSVSGTRRAAEVATTPGKDMQPGTDQLSLIVFRNADDEQFALPLNQVIRIEKIRKSDIQSFGSIRAIPYCGGNLPVYSIDQIASVRPLSDRENLRVIVFMVDGRHFGLLAAGPVDSVMTNAKSDGCSLKQPGIMGSLILKGKTTMLVDILDLVRSLKPDWFPAVTVPELEIKKTRSILLADDSNFFRSQIKSFIQNAGYTVVDAEDGEAAWQILQKSGQDIFLVVTDLEMPRLNGFELTEAIRKDERYFGMPIIALSTLADDKSMDLAKQAGVDEYQIKLDKERLLESIGKLMHDRG